MTEKIHIGQRRFHNNEEVQMAVREWLLMQEFDFYSDGTFNLLEPEFYI